MDIVPVGKSFHFKANDFNPTLTIDISEPKIAYSIQLLNPVNVQDYNMDVTFQNSIVQVFSVSQISFSLKVYIYIYIYTKIIK